MNKPEITFSQVLAAAEEEFHRARHLTVYFPDANELPGLDVGWGAGALFGIHLALAYPKLAGKINRALFLSHPTQHGPNLGADIVAQAITEAFFREDTSEDYVLDKWNELKARLPDESDR